jgi:hypothetical protein
VTFIPPDQESPQIRLGLTDILDHLNTNAQRQIAATAAIRAQPGVDVQRTDEQARRLENVARLVEELRSELAALEALRPPDIT